jgi:hypothetical protein
MTKANEQKERFAGAMIGLGLKLDETFRTHFLTSICGPISSPKAPDWEVQVEPENWGDLVLKHAPSKTLIVVELKIDCPLDDHQNPSKQAFYSEDAERTCPGYGWEIERAAKHGHWRDVRYFTVERVSKWSKPVKKDFPVICAPREWAPTAPQGPGIGVRNRAGDLRLSWSPWNSDIFCEENTKHETRIFCYKTPGALGWRTRAIRLEAQQAVAGSESRRDRSESEGEAVSRRR